jgi:hypothetical protein
MCRSSPRAAAVMAIRSVVTRCSSPRSNRPMAECDSPTTLPSARWLSPAASRARRSSSPARCRCLRPIRIPRWRTPSCVPMSRYCEPTLIWRSPTPAERADEQGIRWPQGPTRFQRANEDAENGPFPGRSGTAGVPNALDGPYRPPLARLRRQPPTPGPAGTPRPTLGTLLRPLATGAVRYRRFPCQNEVPTAA